MKISDLKKEQIALVPTASHIQGCQRTVQSKVKTLRLTAFKFHRWFAFVKVSGGVKHPPAQLDMFHGDSTQNEQ